MHHPKEVFSTTFKTWLPFAIVIVIFSGLAYVTVQQNFRQNANDPQIQIAEDIADAITNQGQAAEAIVPATGLTDMTKTLSPFVVIYDDSGKSIGSSVILDGKNPTMASGVFDYVKKHGEDRLTWQPKSGVRIAAVVTSYTANGKSGFVVAGRSLREVENRIKQLEEMVALAMALALVLTFVIVYFFTHKEHKHSHSETVASL